MKSVWDRIKGVPEPFRAGIGNVISRVSPRAGTMHIVTHYLQATSPSDPCLFPLSHEFLFLTGTW